MKRYGVIMAGGQGTRFWPLSRRSCPKQLLDLSGNGRLVNEAINRLEGIIEKENIFVVTGREQEEEMRRALSGIVEEKHILVEPSARNTAACIGYAACEILKKYGDGIMCVLPSDHYIRRPKEFGRILDEAVRAAGERDSLFTIGIAPSYPATGYGYIKYEKEESAAVKRVLEFKEKPKLCQAEAFIKSGCYAWNSGMFIWKASVILKQFERHQPDICRCLKQIYDALGEPGEMEAIKDAYFKMPSSSIDYGIMEKAEEVFVILGDFGWNDVGSLDMLEVFQEPDDQGNICFGEHLLLDSSGCIAYSKKRLIAGVGISDLIIVETEDALLVCRRDSAQDVRRVAERLKEEGKGRYL